jgi:formylglycine-generating enzyme required for sulfatase activity
MFEKLLRAFETGGLTFSDLQLTLKQQLEEGASPDELLKTMRRRELIEPLPDYAHEEILAIIHAESAVRGSSNTASNADQSSAPSAPPSRAAEAESDEPAMTRLLQSLTVDWDAEPGKGAAAFTGRTALTAEIKTMRAALEQRDQDLMALRDEHARVLGLLETRARAAAQLESDLRAQDAQLEAAQDALQQQQVKTRELSEALSENLAANEAAKQQAQAAAQSQEASRSPASYDAELNALREEMAGHEAALQEARRLLAEREAALLQARRSLDERDSALEQARYSLTEHDAALDQARQLLSERDDALDQARNALIEREDALDQARRLVSERDAQIESLQENHAAIVPALESRAQSAAKLHAELRAALERGAALEADLITAHAALGAEQNKSRRIDGIQAEKNAALAEKKALSARTKALESELKALESELQEARQRIDALTSDAQKGAEIAAAPVAPYVTAAPVVTAAMPPAEAAVKPTVEVTEFLRPPPAKPRAKADIEEFALSPPIDWLRNRLVRTFGICGVVIALVIGIWSFTHHGSDEMPPEVSAPPPPLPGTVIQDCEACPALTVLPAGRFKQGSAEGSSSGFVKPMHWVAIEHSFAMSTNDVTVAEFRAFATATGRNMQGCDVYDGQWKHQPANSWQNPGFEQAANHPVTCASWNDAKAYAQWLSARTGHHYRLPSASEWEYAARAGGNAAQPWGGNGSEACLNANVADSSAAHRYPGWGAFGCNDGYVYTSPVGSFKTSVFGLHDMLGNVFQWTEDCWSANYLHAPIDGSARTDGNCAERELRGGSWFSSPEYVRADYRNHFAADYRTSSVGIRLVRDLAP